MVDVYKRQDYTFIADSETMKVEVAFTFDATSLDGKQLVTFEELYDLSNPDEPKKVTEHKDIEDKGQTITFKEKTEVPEEPEKPETPQTPEKPSRPSDSPKTGDNTNLYGLLALLLTSGAGLAGIFLSLIHIFELIPPFEIVVSRNNLVIDLGTLTDEYEKEISIHTTAVSYTHLLTVDSDSGVQSKNIFLLNGRCVCQEPIRLSQTCLLYTSRCV